MIYLDNAATTFQKPVEVKNAMLQAFESCGSSGRGGYENARLADECVFAARERAADLFGVENPEQVSFTYNATYALNMAIKGIAKCGNCVISGYEHNSVVRPIVGLKEAGVTYTVAKGRLFDHDDMVKKFGSAIRKNSRFAVCTHMSNVFGYILPIEEIDYLCYKKGIPLIIDASQSAGSLPVKMSELRATVCICAPGHKGLYGPQGTGIIVCREGVKLKSIIEGGTGSLSSELFQPEFSPDRFESGTQNVCGIAGLSEGISYVLKTGVENILAHEQKLIGYTIDELIKMPQITLYASREKERQGGVLSFTVEGMSCEEVAARLAEVKIAVRSGLQCSPVAHKTAGTRNGTVRVSVSSFTTQDDVATFVQELKRISIDK